MGVCTLLGPEGPDTDRLLVVCDWTSGPLSVSPVGVVDGGTARTLRTTQWTRASCNSLRVVAQDDLKDH